MQQPYIDVTEFISDPDQLISDGTYYYDDSLYGIVHPLHPNYGLKFFGDYTAFNANSPFSIKHLITVPESGIKKSGMIDSTLVLLDNDGKLHFYKINTLASGEYIDDDFVSNTFDTAIINGTFNDFVVSPNYGNNSAIFIKDDDEVLFHNITVPSDIDTLINERLVVNAAINRDNHFCLVFDTGEILYHNGNPLDDVSYEMIPQAIIDTQDYSSFDTSNKVSPNNLTTILEVVAHDGFSVLTFDGNVIVWGGNFQNINDDTGTELKPIATYDCETLFGNGETYGVALRENGQCNVWGLDEDNRLSNLTLLENIKTVITFPIAVFYTQDQGKLIQHSSDSLPVTDPVLSGIGTYFDLTDVQDSAYFTQQMPYSTDGYFFAVTIHENMDNENVRVDFKLRKEGEKYFIPIMHFMDYEPANISLEVYSTCKSEAEILGENIEFSVVDTYYDKNGMADFSKIVVSPIDKDQNGVPDNPLAYKHIVGENDNIILETFMDNNGLESTRLSLSVERLSKTQYLKEDTVYYADVDKSFVDVDGNTNEYTSGSFYKGVDDVDETIQNKATLLDDAYDEDTGVKYYVKNGKGFTTDNPFKFQWNHYSSDGADRIDPSISTIMDMYVLTDAYDNAVRRWLRNSGDINDFPEPPSSEEIRSNIRFIENNKSTSDQVIYIPAAYKLLFGDSARPEHQAEFKIVKLMGATLTDNEIKSRTIDAINEYFDIDNWDFGESFYFTELAAHIHNELSGHVASVVIVPRFQTSTFGDLFQIRAEPNELFLSTADVENVIITNQYTNQNIRKYR